MKWLLWQLQVKSEQNLQQLCGTPPSFSQTCKRSSTVASAAPMDLHGLQPNLMSTDMAEDVVEASFARGLAAAECFEVSLLKSSSNARHAS